MKPIHLHIEELNYELRIRGILTTRKDVTIKRKMLNRRLDTERGRDIEFFDPEYNIDTEQTIINDTLNQLRALIDEFNGPESDSGFQRIRSRLIHMINRVKRIRIPVDDEDNVVQLFKNESYATCVELEALLFDSIVQEPLLSNSNDTNNSQNTVQSSTSRMSNNFQTVQKSIPVYKWNITKFNGDAKTLMSFLIKVDELAKARNVTKAELLASATDLFSDKAYVWFKSIEKSLKDWDHLVMLLKTNFLPPNFDDSIWDDIRNRTQGKKEPIHIYIAVMQTYFNFLQKPVHEGTKLRYIRKGILPYYNERLSVITTPIKTIEDILEWCKKIDEGQSFADEYHSPAKTSNFFPELNYLSISEPSTSTSNVSVNTISNYEQEKHNKKKYIPRKTHSFKKSVKVSSNLQPTNSNNKPSLICWNCAQPNHSYQYCTARKTRFCFNCGKKNETIRTCSCSKN